MSEDPVASGPLRRFLDLQYASGGSVDRLKKLRDERGGTYGPVEQNHRTIGMQWGGILTHAGWKPGEPVSARVVCLMMVALKLNREAYCHQQDNIDDGVNYLNFAGECSADNQGPSESICERQTDGDSQASCGCDWEKFGGVAGSPE